MPDSSSIVVVGGCNMDIAVSTPVPPTPADSNPGQIACAPGGVARNVAENLARLGNPTSLVSAVGDDVFGQSLRQSTTAAGVNMQTMVVLPTQRTASYVSLHGANGDMDVAVNDMGILEALTPAVLSAHRHHLEQADCMVVDCNLTAPSLAYLLEDIAVRCDIPVFVDGVSVAKCQRIKTLLPHIHTLKLNRLEVQMLSGTTVDTVDQARDAAQLLHHQGVREVVVSLGELGVCWCDATGTTGYLPANRVPVVNTSGAGDALLAGLVHGFLNRWPLVQAVDFAMACAEITLSSPRANHPDLSLAAVQAQRSHKTH
ncbi:PfkB family carbohydrate kinase [Rhodoferax saidenbachensis]|uniref:Carbohydrate kinase PfkB domain-containing protein n=1 Tax=Rhodoferax saidenbachensis TaxID=1484693 RepID=A0A1P8KA02_9BURK|nr:PfkB family carbohydrate kinase [Rhodoferax saidenbachensis]APW42824.1 hypothetical protein RS694_09960 [Rhodoferax saidenbachensis]